MNADGCPAMRSFCDDWVIIERERFRQLRLHAMDVIGARLVASGLCYDALRVGLAATGTDPLRESAHRLVRVHLIQGNVAEAIREYQRYAQPLRTELDGRPSQAMRELLAPYVRAAPT